MEAFLRTGKPFKKGGLWEVETRVTFRGINIKTLYPTIVGKLIRKRRVQKFESVDVYDSCMFRHKFKIKDLPFIIHKLHPVTFTLSKETPERPIHECFEREMVGVAMHLIPPVDRWDATLDKCIEMRIFFGQDDIADLHLELELDPTKNYEGELDSIFDNYLSWINVFTKRLQHVSTYVAYPKKKTFEKMRALKHVSDINDTVFYEAPKWDGKQYTMKANKTQIVFEGRGLTPSEFLPLPINFAQQYFLLHAFISQISIPVERVDNRYFALDVGVRLRIDERIKYLLEMSKQFACISKACKIHITPQFFTPHTKQSNLFQYPPLENTDGYIIADSKNIFKIKDRRHQTVDLLYMEGNLVTREGICLSEKTRINIPVENYKVYECKILEMGPKLYEFRRTDDKGKLRILSECVVQVLKYRPDKGHCPNALKTVFDYLESDILYFVTHV